MFLIAIPWIASALTATAATVATTVTATEAAFIAGATAGYVATKSEEEEK